MSVLIYLGYLGMFLLVFLVVIILFFSFEIVFSVLYSSGLNWVLLFVVVLLGNVFGLVVNYVLGFKFGKEIVIDKLKVSEVVFNCVSYIFIKWGKWSLFLCWVFIIGDFIILVVGVFRSLFWFFIFVVMFSKIVCYVVLFYVFV